MKKADDGRIKKITGATSGLGKCWNVIDWQKAEREVRRLQIGLEYRVSKPPRFRF